MKNKDLTDKVFIITGAARGIGFAISKRLLEEGSRVILADVDWENLQSVVNELNAENAVAVKVDITDRDSISKMFQTATQRFGQLDGLVNNAGILDMSNFDTLKYDRYSQVMRTNLDGSLLCAMEAVPLLKDGGGGVILNIASIMGLFGTPNSIPYSTAKGAMVNLTRCLAVDLAKHNINVNALAPGFIDTRMAQLPDGSSEYATEEFQDVYVKHNRLPIGRTGSADDISGPAVFLLSSDAQYITGQTLVVDGGVTITY